MEIVFTILLAVSIAGMGALLMLKHRELATGRVFLASVRPALGYHAHRVLVWAEQVVPAFVARAVARAAAALRRALHAAAAWGVLATERGLEAALRSLRHKTAQSPRGTEQASEFLREVAAHKQEIIKRSRSAREEE